MCVVCECVWLWEYVCTSVRGREIDRTLNVYTCWWHRMRAHDSYLGVGGLETFLFLEKKKHIK